MVATSMPGQRTVSQCEVSKCNDYSFCANGPILKFLTALESAYLVPKLVKLPRY